MTSQTRNADNLALVSFYHFMPLDGLPLLRARVRAWAAAAGLKGTVLLAAEGINASLCGAPAALEAMLARLSGHLGDPDWVLNHQTVTSPPFARLKVRIRPEIIRFDLVDPALPARAGPHVPARDWNRLLDTPGLRLVDTRNAYEVALGTFQGAENPGTDTFREFTRWVDDNLDPAQDPPVAMFCTGGVRCEKASAWMRARGFSRVYQLKGGILSYLAEVAPGDSRWHGECFVFDDRVSVDHALRATGRALCQGCQLPVCLPGESTVPPLGPDEVTCTRCDRRLESRRVTGMRERERQAALAARRAVADGVEISGRQAGGN